MREGKSAYIRNGQKDRRQNTLPAESCPAHLTVPLHLALYRPSILCHLGPILTRIPPNPTTRREVQVGFPTTGDWQTGYLTSRALKKVKLLAAHLHVLQVPLVIQQYMHRLACHYDICQAPPMVIQNPITVVGTAVAVRSC